MYYVWLCREIICCLFNHVDQEMIAPDFRQYPKNVTTFWIEIFIGQFYCINSLFIATKQSKYFPIKQNLEAAQRGLVTIWVPRLGHTTSFFKFYCFIISKKSHQKNVIVTPFLKCFFINAHITLICYTTLSQEILVLLHILVFFLMQILRALIKNQQCAV